MSKLLNILYASYIINVHYVRKLGGLASQQTIIGLFLLNGSATAYHSEHACWQWGFVKNNTNIIMVRILNSLVIVIKQQHVCSFSVESLQCFGCKDR